MANDEAGAVSVQPLVVLFSAVFTGTICDRFLSIPASVWSTLAVASLLAWGCVRNPAATRTGVGFVLLATCATAALWHHVQWRLFGSDDLGLSTQLRPSPVCADVIALSSPRRRPASPPNPLNTMRADEETCFPVRVIRARDQSHWRGASGQAMLRVTGQLAAIRAGDCLRVLGQLSSPGAQLNPGEPDFVQYERADRRLCRLHVESPECIRILAKGSRSSLTYWLNCVRDHGNANLWRHVSPSRAGLASAVLLGTREQIDRHRNEDFMTTGTVHLLSISGLHVGILVYGFWIIARCGWMSRKKTLVAAVVFVGLYALLTDAQPPVVRASVLVTVMCAARFFGRQAFNFNTLAAAGIVVIVLNPSAFFQAGTQLSFIAVATMACAPFVAGPTQVADPLARLIAETRPLAVRAARRFWSAICRATGLSAAIWLVALPLVMYRFHLVSPIATVLNPIVCLPMAVALFAGIGVMLLGGIAPGLAGVCGWVCDVSLWSMEWCIECALAWRGNHWWLPAPPLWWVLTFYGAAATWLLWPRFRPPRRWISALASMWFAMGFWLTLGPAARVHRREPPELACTFVAVGHGTSVLLEFPGGATMLYDAGRLGTASAGARSISSVLWSRGITHLDTVVISHADADHFNAIPDLLARFSVGVVYVSPVMFRHDATALAPLRESIVSHGIPLRELSAGDRLSTRDRVQLTVLHPPEAGVVGSDNANSIVLLVEYDGRRILLPGDLESPGLEDLLGGTPLDCDVIMAPHHGSSRSNPIGFAQWSSPEHVVISGGLSRDATPVKSAYESAGGRVYHTAELGAIQVSIRDSRYQVTTHRVRAN